MMRLLAYISVLLLVAACGNQPAGQRRMEKPLPGLKFSDALLAMEHQDFWCASLEGGACPEGIGKIIAIDEANSQKSALCTGFMTGPNTMATNHHCLSNNRVCKTTLVSIWDGTSARTSKCKRIIKTLSDYPDKDLRKAKDVTIFELEDSMPSGFFRPSKASPRKKEAVTVWVVDHFSLNYSRIIELGCTVANPSGYASMVLEHCPVIGGNSGSPVVNQNREVIGILWGSSIKKGDTSITEMTELQSRRATTKFKGVATRIESFINFL